MQRPASTGSGTDDGAGAAICVGGAAGAGAEVALVAIGSAVGAGDVVGSSTR
jgi:hypothetical protein